MDIIMEIAGIILTGIVAIGGVWYSDPEGRRKQLRVENRNAAKARGRRTEGASNEHEERSAD